MQFQPIAVSYFFKLRGWNTLVIPIVWGCNPPTIHELMPIAVNPKAMSTLATIVADRRKRRQFVCCRKRRIRRQSPKTATIVASVDRA